MEICIAMATCTFSKAAAKAESKELCKSEIAKSRDPIFKHQKEARNFPGLAYFFALRITKALNA